MDSLLVAWLLGGATIAVAADPVVLRGHAADVFAAAFTPDGGRVVTAGADHVPQPLVDQLRKGSSTLRQLQDDTLAATSGGANPHLRARKVLLAQYERIVETDSFANDPPPITLINKKHTDVCKPGPDDQEPLTHVAACL